MTTKRKSANARLQEAALALFQERGYDGTTAAEIAARAEVTERTFFRHFADKREVLFAGGALLEKALTESLATTPDSVPPIDAIFRAFHSVVPLLEANRPFSEPRQAIISATPALRERELAKIASLEATLSDALQSRGLDEWQADLAVNASVGAFVQATTAWLEASSHTLPELLNSAHRALCVLFAK